MQIPKIDFADQQIYAIYLKFEFWKKTRLTPSNVESRYVYDHYCVIGAVSQNGILVKKMSYR